MFVDAIPATCLAFDVDRASVGRIWNTGVDPDPPATVRLALPHREIPAGKRGWRSVAALESNAIGPRLPREIALDIHLDGSEGNVEESDDLPAFRVVGL